MKTGLKIKLINFLKAQGGKHIPHWQVMGLVRNWKYRESNAERRLRESPEIGKDYENGVIKAYYYKADSLIAPVTPQNAPETTFNHAPDTCYSFKKFNVYCQECRKEINAR